MYLPLIGVCKGYYVSLVFESIQAGENLKRRSLTARLPTFDAQELKFEKLVEPE